jgi:predicted dinucleotide-binding enzyme
LAKRLAWLLRLSAQSPKEIFAKIGFIGAGRVATIIGRHLIGADNKVALSILRGPAALAALLADMGPAASAGSKQELRNATW